MLSDRMYLNHQMVLLKPVAWSEGPVLCLATLWWVHCKTHKFFHNFFSSKIDVFLYHNNLSFANNDSYDHSPGLDRQCSSAQAPKERPPKSTSTSSSRCPLYQIEETKRGRSKFNSPM